MNKLLIASDLHGDAYYISKLVEAFKKEEASRLILLGDILYHGPRNAIPVNYSPSSAIPMLNSIKDKISCIKGNCDSEVDEMVLEFPFVKESIIVFPSFKIFLTHGHIINKDNMPMLSKGDILLYGHTHIPMWHTDNNGIRIFNPGSVSIPKNNSKNSYMTLDEKCAIWKDVQTMDEYHKEILL